MVQEEGVPACVLVPRHVKAGARNASAAKVLRDDVLRDLHARSRGLRCVPMGPRTHHFGRVASRDTGAYVRRRVR